jgi:cytochrome c-type biogenesis protein CcmH/NrfG
MVEYRKGNLKGAISVWESLLAFDPDNEQIKKAIETARAQLQQIKN